MIRVASKEDFLERLLAVRDWPAGVPSDAEIEALTLWELGFDSGAMIEIVFAVEDLGVLLPDDLPWARLGVWQLYELYVEAAVDNGF